MTRTVIYTSNRLFRLFSIFFNGKNKSHNTMSFIRKSTIYISKELTSLLSSKKASLMRYLLKNAPIPPPPYPFL